MDARSGRAPSRRQQLVRAATRRLWTILCQELPPKPSPTPTAEQAELRRELDRGRARHAENPEALHAELRRITAASKPPYRSCLPILARPLLAAAIDLPVYSALGQSLPDRLAGTVVVREPRPRRRRVWSAPARRAR
ncbi:MAG TPA: hypothetical protein VGY13_00760 [Solirubrobacteraceae bacterium]|nr:hypothetical protein [Solirubrobacteraceae bacterium]